MTQTFWTRFDRFPSGAGLLADWRAVFEGDFPALRPLLVPTERHASSFPCRSVPGCGCRHDIRDTRSGLAAVCSCGAGECEPFDLEPKDMLIYALDGARLCEAVRVALGFAAAEQPSVSSQSRVFELGIYAPLHAPVRLCFPANPDALLREVETLIMRQAGPFILLTPTRAVATPEIEAVLRRAGCLWLSLSLALDFEPGPRLRLAHPLEPLLAEWAARLAASRDPRPILDNIHREIAAVRSSFVELRSAKERLEQMLADGLFAFTRKVDAESFKVFCAILAEGNVAKAALSLGLPHSTLWDLLQNWRARGDAYKTMLDLVRWRKKVGRRQTVTLNENILLQKADAADYPALLSDVLDALLSMTDENWRQQCEDLLEVVRPVVR
jgi:hypothetical protein